MTDVRPFVHGVHMRNGWNDDEDWSRERALDRDLEREGGYSSPRRIPLNARGAVRVAHLAGVLHPPVKIGGAA